jgi:hypothetical protein
VSYKGRTELLGSTNMDLKRLIDFQVGINLSFGPKDANTFGIAYDLIQGANPLSGLRDQQYQTLTAKVKFTIQ